MGFVKDLFGKEKNSDGQSADERVADSVAKEDNDAVKETAEKPEETSAEPTEAITEKEVGADKADEGQSATEREDPEEMRNRLKKLSRAELLQLLIDQTKRAEDAEDRVEELEKKLEDRKIMISEAGSLAEASLKLGEVFEAAQKACDIYIENIKMMQIEHSNAKEEILRKAEEERLEILKKAEEERAISKSEAEEHYSERKKKAEEILSDAEKKAREISKRAEEAFAEMLKNANAEIDSMLTDARKEQEKD